MCRNIFQVFVLAQAVRLENCNRSLSYTKCGYTTIIYEPCHTVFIIYWNLWVFINRIWEMTSLHVKCLCKKTSDFGCTCGKCKTRSWML